MTEVLAIIPARSGSKSITHKNIRLFNGKPLIAYSIEHALNATYITRVIVSTDSDEYAEIARYYGAETPFIRPAKISCDTSLDIEVFNHALNWLADNESYHPDICVHLRPTHPIRKTSEIDEMIRLLQNNLAWDSVRSVCRSPLTPYKMWTMSDKNVLSPVAYTNSIKEPYNAPRQVLPTAYIQNACIDVVRSEVIINQNSMTGEVIGGYLQSTFFDIDSESDFITAEVCYEILDKLQTGRKMTICFDIDGLIAEKNLNNDYTFATPNFSIIKLINKLSSFGHTIILHTARGSKTGVDWKELTEKQLSTWGVSYSTLSFGKPAADIYVDDRYWSIDSLEKLLLGEL